MILFRKQRDITLKCVVQAINILNEYPRVQDKQITHISKEEEINKSIPWAYFDGASQETPPRGGVEEYCLYLQPIAFHSNLELARKQIITMI
jgi:hypothetical protein